MNKKGFKDTMGGPVPEDGVQLSRTAVQWNCNGKRGSAQGRARRKSAIKTPLIHWNDPPGATRCRQCGSWAGPCARCVFRWCDEGLFPQTLGGNQQPQQDTHLEFQFRTTAAACSSVPPQNELYDTACSGRETGTSTS